jgi:TPP-dependent pyruvate/acetoin dehydrogenase alpha subunit
MAAATNMQAAQPAVASPAPKGAVPPPDLGKERELAAFRQMLLIRRFEERPDSFTAWA